MSEVNVEVNDVTEQPPPQPEVKRGRGRPAGALSKGPRKTDDENYTKNYYLTKLKPIIEAKELHVCEYCKKTMKHNSIRAHNNMSFCSKFLRNKIQ